MASIRCALLPGSQAWISLSNPFRWGLRLGFSAPYTHWSLGDRKWFNSRPKKFRTGRLWLTLCYDACLQSELAVGSQELPCLANVFRIKGMTAIVEAEL